MRNQVQLITYVDRFSAGGLTELKELIEGPFKGIFGGIHILPFFYPIDGSDAGFDPIDHLKVDPRLGNWGDIKGLSEEFDLMADMIVNHVSSDSPQYQDYLKKGSASEYADMFLTMDKVFPEKASEEDLLTVYRPRPGLPFDVVVLETGERKLVWTTFTKQQIDIDVYSRNGEKYLDDILSVFHANGIRMIRLDAVGYAVKKAGTSCFMIPESYEFISTLTNKARKLGMEVLVEIHSYYKRQMEIASKVDWVYDFALPPLVLLSFFRSSPEYLKKWLKMSPRNAITVLDTHDGIGIIDIGRDNTDRTAEGLVPDQEVKFVVDTIHKMSGGTSNKASGASASNLDIYQVNCTFYEALGKNDRDYLLARAIQFFSPGIPQVYYGGFLAAENDMELLEKTGVGRDINRHYFSKEELKTSIEKPVVKNLINLIKFRNSHSAFKGNFELLDSSAEILAIRWTNDEDYAELSINFSNREFEINYSGMGVDKSVSNDFKFDLD